jgi:Na+-translocating ferredoxin:NAD+ oxidoreductase RnfG subunit
VNKTLLFLLLFVVKLSVLSSSYAQVFKTKDEALRQAFPEQDSVARKVLFLTTKQVAEIQKLAKAKVESKIVTYYVASKADSVLGYAFFETDIVRTKPATFVVVVNPDGTVKYIEILAFYEPADYLPTNNWLDLFKEKQLNENLWPKRGIHNITGATLTVRALTMGVRKTLAIFEMAVPKEESK